jgi:hypothetical protein
MLQPQTHLLLASVLLVGLDVIANAGVAGLGEAVSATRASLAARTLSLPLSLVLSLARG